MAPGLLHLNSRAVMARATVKETLLERPQLPDNTRNSRVLVLGGTRRVGGSTTIALSKLSPHLQLVVGRRNREKAAAMVGELGKNSEFAEVNIENLDALETALRGAIISPHTGYIFRLFHCSLLEF